MSFRRIDSRAIESYLKDQVTRLRHGLSRLRDDMEPHAVHRARIATRRLRSVLDLIRPLVHARHFRPMESIARKLRRGLGRIREIDVMLADLKKHAKVDASQMRLAQSLKKRREKALARLIHSSVLKRKKMFRVTNAFKRELKQLRPASASIVREGILSNLDTFGHTADRACAADHPVNLHELRIAAKRLRYQLEIARAVGFRMAGASAMDFELLQHALGKWHDEIVMAQAMAKYAARKSRFERSPQEASRLVTLSSKRLASAALAFDRFRSHWHANGNRVIASVRTMMELQVSRPRTDRDRQMKR